MLAMPEYLAPGVYLEETDANVTPIPGVPTSIDDETARGLVAAVEPIIRRFLPDWSGFNDSDPGVTLVQLFAFLSESLLYRFGPGERRQLDVVLRAMTDVARAAGCAAERSTLKRPVFFDGRMLDAASLRREQQYHLDRHRRHNLDVHGCGVVSGLEVGIDASGDSAGRIVVEPGYAIDRCGDEVALAERLRVPLPANRDDVFVSVRRWEQRCGDSSAQSPAVDADCIEDACLIAIGKNVSPCALAVARLVRSDGRWVLDTAFVALRSGSR